VLLAQYLLLPTRKETSWYHISLDKYLWQPAESDYNFNLTDDAKELLFEFIRGHPGLTCRAGTKILELVSKRSSLESGNTAPPPFSFTRHHAVSILHSIIFNSGHETPLNDIVNALEHRFESGESLKDVLHSLLLEGNRPGIHHATKELYFAIDKRLLRFEERQKRKTNDRSFLQLEQQVTWSSNAQTSRIQHCSSNGEQSIGATGRTPSSEDKGRVRGADIKEGKR
jgi:hypothetical protein